MRIDEHTRLADVVVAYPQTRTFLEELGLDYCCGGRQSLEEACAARRLSPRETAEQLRRAAEAHEAEQAGRPNLSDITLAELVDYIVRTHHVFLRNQLPRLADLHAKVRKAHQQRHGPMLTALAGPFQKLRTDIEMHLAKEENILFPLIREMEAYVRGSGPEPMMHCGSIGNPIAQMEYEHEIAGTLLAEIRRITSDYQPPSDTCASFKALYDGLRELEDNLHEHIHIENNILFPKAMRLADVKAV